MTVSLCQTPSKPPWTIIVLFTLLQFPNFDVLLVVYLTSLHSYMPLYPPPLYEPGTSYLSYFSSPSHMAPCSDKRLCAWIETTCGTCGRVRKKACFEMRPFCALFFVLRWRVGDTMRTWGIWNNVFMAEAECCEWRTMFRNESYRGLNGI